MAYRIIIQPGYPGWGNWIERGATTLWEHWARRDTKKHASLNHIMFGDVSNWFYQYIAGIRPDNKVPGFKHFYVEPMLTEQLDWAKADFESAYGTIKAEWKKQNGQITLDVQVPANTSATIILPKGELTNVDKSKFKNVSVEHAKTVIKVGSGNYKINLDI